MDEKTVTVGVRMPPELRDRLKAMADADRRTLSQFCYFILQDFVRSRAEDDASAR